jgi:hypothetical protein
MKRGHESDASSGDDSSTTSAVDDSAVASGNTTAAAGPVGNPIVVPIRRNPSDLPSKSAANEHGFNILNYLFRSILAHPLGLPLAAIFARQILPPTLKYPVAAYDKKIFDEPEGDDILLASYGTYERRKTSKKPWTEAQLTKNLCKKIKKDFGQHFNVKHQAAVNGVRADNNQAVTGKTDIMIFTKAAQGGQSTPVAVLEFGLLTADWMQKLSQGVKYLNIMLKESNPERRFTKPLLLAIITLNKSSAGDFEFSIGVFLCSRKRKNDADADDGDDDNFRLSLVWKHQDTNKDDASRSFDSFLRNANRFQKWRDIEVSIQDFEYLSSNCCKVNNHVSGRPAPSSLVNDVRAFGFG